jgi:hypothetical protein
MRQTSEKPSKALCLNMVLMHTFLGKLTKINITRLDANSFASHIHWYERMWPLTSSGAVDNASIINPNTYYTNAGVSMTHLINGMAGNIESHSELDGSPIAAKTAYLDTTHYGFNKVTFFNSTVMKFEFVLGLDGTVADELTLIKPQSRHWWFQPFHQLLCYVHFNGRDSFAYDPILLSELRWLG